MTSVRWMGREWRTSLADLLRDSDDEVVIVAPYITDEGAAFTIGHLSPAMKESGTLRILTDLSPMPICQGATDPSAVRRLAEATASSTVHHLPRLHAKVYLSGGTRAIVTSGNLTRGGLFGNHEYGVCSVDPDAVSRIRQDVLDYAALGSQVSTTRLVDYCALAEVARESYRSCASTTPDVSESRFREAYKGAEDELYRIRLGEGPIHSVFEAAILHFLRRGGPLTTPEIHDLIEASYPDLCDNSLDRIIDGVRFGKRWKHAVRTAQQHLKKKMLIDLVGGGWHAVDVRDRGT